MGAELQVVCHYMCGKRRNCCCVLLLSPSVPNITSTIVCLLLLQVVSAPVIGKVSQVGIERVLGTVIGGLTGYAVYILGSLVWNTTSDGRSMHVCCYSFSGLGVANIFCTHVLHIPPVHICNAFFAVHISCNTSCKHL